MQHCRAALHLATHVVPDAMEVAAVPRLRRVTDWLGEAERFSTAA